MSKETSEHRARLEDRRHRLMNNFGYGAFQDGLTRQAIEQIDRHIAQLDGAQP